MNFFLAIVANQIIKIAGSPQTERKRKIHVAFPIDPVPIGAKAKAKVRGIGRVVWIPISQPTPKAKAKATSLALSLSFDLGKPYMFTGQPKLIAFLVPCPLLNVTYLYSVC